LENSNAGVKMKFLKITLLATLVFLGLQAHAEFTGFPEKILAIRVSSSDLLGSVGEPRILVSVTCDQNLLDIFTRGYNECGVLSAVGSLKEGTIKLPAASLNPGVPATLSKYGITFKLVVNDPQIFYRVIDEISFHGEADILKFYHETQAIVIENGEIVLK